ncbi:alpha/beta fold hydrolase [Gallibacterium anatis]|uniref:alpha/beta fold hydrolase n=1 Tax=Gallibacterium anatis TaxID=750 RepID=UPI002550D911|nr:alpha/beta fold hydrolase [Gallibacterium anatis]WIM84232.1 alpha/beta fold hydrolase [Gallibacterium anatis]
MVIKENFSQFVQQQLLPFVEQFPMQYIEANQQKKIAFRHFIHQAHQKLIVLVNGRAENILKWSEVAYDFYQQGFDVLLFDHRGQGFSDRLLKDREKGYIDRFQYYLDDMDLVIQTVLRKKVYEKQYLLAHSMGGLISTCYLAKYPHQFNKVILSAPFWGLAQKTVKRDEIIVAIMTLLGFSQHYVFGKGAYKAADLATTPLSHSTERMAFMNEIAEKYPNVRLGGPTFSWVHHCIIIFAKLKGFIAKITVSTLILRAEQDLIVSNTAINEFSSYFSDVILKNIEKSKHEILFETDEIRQSAFKEIMAFLAKD